MTNCAKEMGIGPKERDGNRDQDIYEVPGKPNTRNHMPAFEARNIVNSN